jgi:S1-C subfamily serine protease
MTQEHTFADVSDGLATAVERVAPSLVTVSARRRIPATGVIWADGLVVTSDHVIEHEDEIRVRLHGAEEAQSAELVGRDPATDLALLRVDGASSVAELVPEGTSKVGQLVLAVGLPGTDPEASLGVVSGFGSWRRDGRRGGRGRRGRRDGAGRTGGSYLRTDTTMFPGFSGGPLVDAHGRVAGINTSRFGRGNTITIPGETVSEVVASLRQHGRILRAYVGIGSQVTPLPAAQAGKLGGDLAGLESGLLVVGIEEGSPADLGGLLVGDILVGFEGAPLSRTEDLQEQLGPDRVGQASELTVLRGGEPATVTVTPSERP